MICLKNATYIDAFTLQFTKTNILVHEGIDGKIEFSDIVIDGCEIIDCTGLFVTKSFVNAHQHIYSALATGMPQPAKSPNNFSEILQYVWWNLDKKLDADTIRASAYVAAIEAIRNGTTFVIDHHASPFFVEGSLEIIAKVFDEIGLSHLLCYEISDRDGKEIAEKGLYETENYLKKYQGLVGLHASFTLENETMKKAADLMFKYNSGVHIHVAEDKVDQIITKEKYNLSVVERLNEFGILDSKKTILAHAIHLDDNEREILSESSIYIVQNSDSNLNNKVGFFNPKDLVRDCFLLGTDGMHSNMIKSAQTTYFTGNYLAYLELLDVYYQLRNNNLYIKFNEFKGDSDNNLIVFDYKYYTEFNKANFLGHFFYGLNNFNIKHVISKGKCIYKNNIFLTLDLDSTLKYTREQAKNLWKKL